MDEDIDNSGPASPQPDPVEIERQNAEFRKSCHELNKKLLRAEASDTDQEHIKDSDLDRMTFGDISAIRIALRMGEAYLDASKFLRAELGPS